ncbi:MAG TPA: DnaJ domain-containing protein [Candidatus Dormibacteraeota bacterium]|nr:DnaJ domain-containing protein [Candidatus Dormibacteraeota bacterium]
MTFSGDPYRILGLSPGASSDDVKRAYRRLAKRYHPDTAGPDAVPRFIAIQRAYEALGGPSGRQRAPGAAARGSQADRSSQADADRARATRQAYRGRGWASAGRGPWTDAGRDGATDAGWTSGGPETSGAGAGGGRASSDGGRRTASGGSRGTASNSRGEDGRAQGGASRAEGRDGRRRSAAGPGGAGSRTSSGDASRRGPGGGTPRRTGRRKATLSSTSYDDAAQEPRHPEWQGSSWYGTSSGTYWTINPREYADPRKHGPEYQARARRAAEASGPETDGASPPEPAPRPPDPVSPLSPPDPAASAGASKPPEPAPAPSPIPTAGSIGLASGVVVAVPAAVVVLASTMAGDLSLAALALAAPAIVAGGVALAVGILRRSAA